jgi:hypothetical protein
VSAFDFYRLLHQARFNTRLVMGRYRVWFVDGLPVTTAELLAFR